MKLAFGAGGTDWQERIDFARMRKERLAKGQAMLKKYGMVVVTETGHEVITNWPSEEIIPVGLVVD
ncbi:MAG: hypothetical protein WCO26_02000 [Deltaproteobacteria bacterium]